MKSLMLCLILGLTLVGCSKNESSKAAKEVIIELDAKSGSFTGTADYGIFPYNSTSVKLITFSLKNSGSENLVGVPAIDNPLNFELIYTNCPSSLAPTKSCSIKVIFDPRGRAANTYQANLTFDSVFVALTAVVSPPIPPENGGGSGGSGSGGSGGSSAFVALVNSVDSTSGVLFGSFTGTQTVVKTIMIKNNGTVPSLPFTATLSSPDFYMAYNQCSNIVLNPTKQCQVKVSFSSGGKAGQDYSSALNFGDLSVPLSATVVTPGGTPGGSGGGGPTPPSYSLSLIEGATEVSNPLDFGSLSGNQSLTKVLYVKNTGTTNVTLNAVMDNSNFSIIFTQCTNRNLVPNATCQLRLQFAASGKNPQVYSSSINFASQNISFPVTSTVGCLSSQHLENSLCVNNIVSCPITNGLGEKTWNGTEYGSCVALSCSPNFEIYQNQCYSEMSVSPSSRTVNSGAVVNLNVVGGVPPYAYQINPVSSIGSVIAPSSGNNAIGVYTAGANSGATTAIESIKITDQRGIFVTSVIQVSSTNPSTVLSLAGNNSTLQYGNSYNFSATGGTPPYSYSLISSIGSAINSNSGSFTPGDNQQIDSAIDLIKVTDSVGAFVEIKINVPTNIQSMYPALYNPFTAQYVSSYSSNSSSVSIVIKNAPLDKYYRVYKDSSCSGNQISESYTYSGDIYVSDNIMDSFDVSQTYSVSVEDIDPETQQPLFTNVQCSSYTVTYLYDITPPDIYSVAATGNGTNIVQLSGGTTSDQNTVFTYYNDLNCTNSIGSSIVSSSLSYDVGSNPGVFFFTAKAADAAGNISECSNGGNTPMGPMNYYATHEHLLGDSGLYPLVVGTSVHNNIAYYNQANIPVYVYGNSIEMESADLFLNNTCSGSSLSIANQTGISPYNTYIQGAFVFGGIYTDANLSPLVDGTYQVYARRGNEQTSNFCSVSSMPFVIDTQSPSAPSIALVQGTYNSVGNINFTITGMEPNVDFSLGRSCQNSPYGLVPYSDTLSQLPNFSASSYDYNLGNEGGFYRFGVSIKDRAGNYSQCSNLITYEYDNGKPYITEVSSSTPDGVYGLGQNINVRLTFNKPIQKINDSGSISLRISNTVSRNVSLSNSVVSGSHLDFTYTVQANDNTGSGKISVENFSNSGIVDASDNLIVANTKIPDAGISKRLEEDHSLKADGVGPTTGTLAFALTGGGNNYSNSVSASAPVNVLTTGVDQGGGVVAGYEVAIGTSTSNRTNILNWTSVGNSLSNLSATGLNLSQTSYYLSFRSYDNFGNRSGFFRFSGQTYGIFVVDSIPTAGKISFVDDREFGTSDVQTMSINFSAATIVTGEASDVAKYYVAIGTEPGGTSVLNWSDINNHNSSFLYNNSLNKRYKVQVSALNLDANTIYYASIKYCDHASNCKEAYGNGFTLKNSDLFDQKNYMKSSNKIANGKFGSAVAVEGNYMVVGAPGEGVGGRVYIYKRVPGTNQLIEEVVLSGSNTESGDEFGAAVAISGNRIIVGAPAEDGASNTISNSGAAYIFKKSTTWSEESILRAHNAGADDRFGDRVKISQLNAAVAALYEDSDHTGVAWTSFLQNIVADNNNVSNSGAVYTFTVDPVSQQWTYDAYIKKTNTGTCGSGSAQCAESANDNFGFAMDLKGPVLVVGTPYHDYAPIGFLNNYIQSGNASGSGNAAHRSGYPNSGGAYVFHKQTYIWSSAYALRSPNIDPGDEFGYSISINELDSTSLNHSELPINIPNYTVAIGAPGEDHGSFISSVHTDVWQGGGTIDNLTSRRYFTGTSSLPVFGATGSTGTFLNNNITDSGAVYVFAFEPLWYGQTLAFQVGGGNQPISMQLHSFVKAPNLGVGDRFGSSVALVGNTTYGWDRITNSSVPPVIQRPIGYLVVGAPKEDNSATGVQLWATSANIWNGTSHITDNNSSSDSGAVYVFKSGYENTVNSPSQQRTDFVLQQYIKAPVSKSGDEFGSQISASVNSWIIGVPLDDANSVSSESDSGSSDTSLSNSGAAYIINNID